MSNFVPEKTALGIEFGSTRIKAVLIGPEHTPLAQGDYTWENQLHNGIWTYPLEQVWQGLQSAYAALAADVQQKYGCTLTKVGCIGISAMMHGYLAFDKDGALLTPFRTWRNACRPLEGSWVGAVSLEDLPVEMEVDWVRFYQRKSIK